MGRGNAIGTRWLVAATVAVSALGCSGQNPLFCAQDRPCTDPERSFCDLGGNFAGSDFTPNTCIAPPDDGCDQASRCTDPAAPICGPEGTCAACTAADSPDAACAAAKAGTPRCADDGRCVECLSSSECTEPDKAICGPESGACRGCEDHSECESQVCDRESGLCVLAADVIYVSVEAGEDGETCGTETSPCKTIGTQKVGGAFDKVGGSRTWIRLAAGIYDEILEIQGVSVQIAGPPDAVLRPTLNAGESPVAITDSPAVLIDGITVTSIAGDETSSVRCTRNSVDTGLELRQATITSLPGVGLIVSGCTVDIVGGTIEQSGDNGVQVDGGTVSIVGAEIAENMGRGIRLIAGDVIVRDSLLARNVLDGLGLNDGSAAVFDSRIEDQGRWGVSAGLDSVLTLERNVIARNQDSGVVVSNDVRIVNNMIVENGNLNDGLGAGVRLSDPGAKEFVIEFNTIANNKAPQAKTSSFLCAPAADLVFSNNIIYGGEGGGANLGGDCVHTFSNIENGPAGGGNIDEPPVFVDPENGDYHLAPGSPGIDAADPNATLKKDFDFEQRPQNGRADMGADEVVP